MFIILVHLLVLILLLSESLHYLGNEFILHTCFLKTSILDIYEKLFSIPWHDLWGHVTGYFGIDVISKIYFHRQCARLLVGSTCLVNFTERLFSMWIINDHQINSLMSDLFSSKPNIHSPSLLLNISVNFFF